VKSLAILKLLLAVETNGTVLFLSKAVACKRPRKIQLLAVDLSHCQICQNGLPMSADVPVPMEQERDQVIIICYLNLIY